MKKVLSLLLVAVLALGMTVSGFAADEIDNWNDFLAKKPIITGFADKITLADGLEDSNTDLGDVIPQKGDKESVEINLRADMFEYEDDLTLGTSIADKNITKKIWRDSKMSVRMAVSSGSKAIDSYKFDDGVIKIEFVDEFVSTKELDFEFKVYLVIDSKRQNDAAAEFTGTLKNYEMEAYAEDDYVDLSDGAVVEAQDFIKDIEVDLGEGVSIHTKFFKGKKYYGTASRDIDASDDAILSKYPDIESVVTLKTIGLNGTGNIVALDSEFGGYYVYDKDLNYLGEANEMLPYSTKYYLSSKKLDIVSDEEPMDDVDEEELPPTTDTENPASGGDDAPVNVNDNPGTGR